MNETDSDPGQALALFRYGLIADLIRLAPGAWLEGAVCSN